MVACYFPLSSSMYLAEKLEGSVPVDDLLSCKLGRSIEHHSLIVVETFTKNVFELSIGA